MYLKNVSDEVLAAAVAASTSMRYLFISLGVNLCGGNYATAYARIRKQGLSTDHWNGPGHGLGNVGNGKQLPFEEVFVKGSTYHGGNGLKKKLFDLGLRAKACSICGLTDWLGKPITLQLDHINGQNTDNRIENLRILCPNCHTQTDTFAGRKLKKAPNACSKCGANISREAKTCGPCSYEGKPTTRFRANHEPANDHTRHTCSCGSPISARSTFCRQCTAKARPKNYKVVWPDAQTLHEMLKSSSYVQVGKSLGVSDNAVRKHLKSTASNPCTN